MIDQSLSDTHSDIRMEHPHLVPFVRQCYRTAVNQLCQSFTDCRPAALLISESRFSPEQVVDSFVAEIDQPVTVARISGVAPDSQSFMQSLVNGLGFKANEMSVKDLENVLDMFLRYQKNHQLRTVFSIQDADLLGWWALDKLRRLVEMEAKESFGLMLIITGPPELVSVFNEPGLNIVTDNAGEQIVLAPFSETETADYLSHRARAAEPGNGVENPLSFDSFAASFVYDLSSGVPDKIDRIAAKCLALVDGTGERTLTVDIVKTAARLAGMTNAVLATDITLPVLEINAENSPPGRLLARTKGEADIEVSLDQNCILIGRDKLCGICISGLRVSRYHALVVLSQHGLQVVDLGSTNGTVVNGHKIKRCSLDDGDVINIGHTRISYEAGCERQAWADDIERTGEFEICDAPPPQPSINYLGKDVQLLRTS